MKDEVDTLKSLIERVSHNIFQRHRQLVQVTECLSMPSCTQMFEKHKDAQSESLKDIEQEVKSLKSLLSRRPGGASDNNNPNISRSASPSQSNLSAVAQSYQPPSSSYTPSSSRYGLSSTAGAGQSGMSPSSSFANILNRPPGIPAWQMQPSASSTSIASSATPTPAAPTATAPAGDETADNNASVEDKTPKQDDGYIVDEAQAGNTSDKVTTLEGSGEIVPSSSDVTA